MALGLEYHLVVAPRRVVRCDHHLRCDPAIKGDIGVEHKQKIICRHAHSVLVDRCDFDHDFFAQHSAAVPAPLMAQAYVCHDKLFGRHSRGETQGAHEEASIALCARLAAEEVHAHSCRLDVIRRGAQSVGWRQPAAGRSQASSPRLRRPPVAPRARPLPRARQAGLASPGRSYGRARPCAGGDRCSH